MSVIVKGMEMPDSCSNCELCACYTESKGEVYRCDLTMTPVKYFEIRLEDCPLVEVPTPHGRLIDADAIPYIFGSTHATEYDTVTKFVINKLPTIIGAEGT